MSELDIFSGALLCPTKDARATFLDEACGPTGPRRDRIEQLLALHETDNALLDHQPAALLAELGDDAMGHEPEIDLESVTKHLLSCLAPATTPGSLGRLGHYDILHVIGYGGFGIVVKAHDDSLHRVVAIKIIAPHLATTSAPRRRFLREARSAASVCHENVVQIHAVEEQPLPYLVMEFVNGLTLQQQIDATGPLDPAEVVRLGRQIALGLAVAHEKGLIHRDVKPANILLEAGVETRVKLTDFGLARTSEDASVTRSGIVAGSPMYMSPEQIRGEALDRRADLFSFGSVLYTMTTGRPPFRAANTLAILKRVAEETPRPIREVVPDVPEGLCAVISRLQNKDPARRFDSAGKVAQALSTCLTDSATSLESRWMGRMVAALAAAVLLLGACGIWAMRDRSPPLSNNANLASAAPISDPAADAVSDPAVSAEKPKSPEGFLVTSIMDDGSPGTLRWAVSEANLHHGEDTITFDPTTFSTPQSITLKDGPLVFIDPVQTKVIGPPGGLTISGGNKGQVFVIGADDTRTNPARGWIADLTIANGNTTSQLNTGGGVLIRGGSTLMLNGCTLRDNSSMQENCGGGAIFIAESTLIMTDCTLTRNEALEGGAIKNYAGVAKVTNCTFVSNSAPRVGGAIYTLGFNRARTEINNCLFQDNSRAEVWLGDGLEHTGDNNLSTDDSAPGSHSLHSTSARLGPLGRYGGPTEIYPLLTDSPGLNRGNNELVPAECTADQRGKPRISGKSVDIGAFEAQ